MEVSSAGCRRHLRDMRGCWRSQTERLPLPQGYFSALMSLHGCCLLAGLGPNNIERACMGFVCMHKILHKVLSHWGCC